MKKFFKHIILAAVVVLGGSMFTACTGDLNVEPIDPSLKSEVSAEQLFNKCYSVFATSGNNGGDDNVDVDGLDGGFQHKFRQMWNSNELTTDEAICGWGDEGISSYCHNSYDASHPMLRGYYYGLCIGITFCNQYLAEFAEYDATMSAEIRFLRAFQFYLLTDAFGNIPFTTTISGDNPEQYTRAQVFEFIEKELKDIIGEGEGTQVLNDPAPKKYGETGYGRIDKAAAWLLLARLYLNAEVYTGTDGLPNGTARWAEARDYAKKVMDSPYKVFTAGYKGTGVDGVEREFSAYQMLFMGDNATTDAAYEAVFPVIQNGVRTTSFGGTNFLIASTFDSDMHPYRYDATEVNGLYNNNTWGGNRARPDLIRKFFPDFDPISGHAYDVADDAGDDRALFETEGRFINVEDESNFKYGYAVAKFTNFKCDGSKGSDIQFPDSHLFYMRAAEAYLTYAEAEIRLNGVTQDAVDAVNVLRDRARTTKFNINTLTLDKVLDEWSREFYFEGRRRVDLIRFGKFGGDNNYNWQWKGGAYSGRNFESFRNVFAIPTDDLIANSNLQQNKGYK
ncbi:MAG: RagB/SusD family nutrient uptake outer membrane protein [Muribaculaceae bacterium]|nr:RagB/SusD family nutrient uptake outer membrane protein [Muribaculaceae bacterium]